MKRLLIIICLAVVGASLAPLQPAGAWKKPSNTDLRGQGTILVDALTSTARVTCADLSASDSVKAHHVAADTSVKSGTVTVRGDSITSSSQGRYVAFDGTGHYLQTDYFNASNDVICPSYNSTSLAATFYGPMTTSHLTVNGKADIDSLGIGGGAVMAGVDTSAAGDSLKVTYMNGNKSLIFQTEVKP